MDKIFFSADNKSRLLCLLKSNGIGIGLQTKELLDVITPYMKHVYKIADKRSTISDLNQTVLYYYKKRTVRSAPSPIRIEKTEKMSQEEIQSFMALRDQFDVSIGLRPVTRTVINNNNNNENLQFKEEQIKHPLDAFFDLL